MTEKDRWGRDETEPCLSNHDLYRYVSAEAIESDFKALEQHLASCPNCREELAGLLTILHYEDGKEPIPATTDKEIDDALAVVKEASRRERAGHGGARGWYGWAGWAAAAAAIIVTAGGLWAFQHFASLRKSGQFLAEGRTRLEEVYAPSSSSGLRLDLPFRSAATSRNAQDAEPWKESEMLFHKALALNEGRVEAYLGLGASLLGQGRFSHAEGAFQKALELGAADARASLGRGVARFEEALRSRDPLDRDTMLKNAMADFEAVLRQNPGSLEAHYNKITVLYETGRHREAAREIDAYLLRDPDSIWAARLRDLKAKIDLMQPRAVEEQVNRAASARDGALLEKIVRLAPDRVPAAIQTALRGSLQQEGESPAGTGPTAADLRWAGEVLAGAYAASARDQSYRTMLAFYDGLSPPMRRFKRELDSRLTLLMNQYQQGEIPQVLQESDGLLREFSRLSDHWQLLNLHHLRGNCYYYTARFDRAED
ncbi:MAG: tetratricopeptide repeat protein, partial [Acidobacteriota bacterium]